MSDLPDARVAPVRRRRLLVVAVVVAAAAAIGVAIARNGGGVRPDVELKAAEEALRQNDPAGARAHVDRVLANRPNDERALFLAAQAARRTDACADAERYLTSLEQAAGPTTATRLEWLLLGAQQGDFGGEEERLQTDVRQGHAYAPEILEALAKGYNAAYRWPEAVLTLTGLLERAPRHVPALVLRGTILDRLRQVDKAHDDLRKAVELAPANAAAHVALAGELNRRGQTREAILHFEIARRSLPADPAVKLGLARALADAADVPAAEGTLDELLAADPEHADALVDRARIPLRQRRPAEAVPFLERAVRAAPWHREARKLYLGVLRELGRPDAALESEARLAEMTAEDAIAGRLKLRARDNAGDTAVRWDLWLWSVRNGDVAEGFAWLTEILRADPGHAAAHGAMAEHFDRAGQPRRAAEHRGAAEKRK